MVVNLLIFFHMFLVSNIRAIQMQLTAKLSSKCATRNRLLVLFLYSLQVRWKILECFLIYSMALYSMKFISPDPPTCPVR